MSASIASAPPIPKLRDGERLSRAEFERRYEAMPDVKAELLDGVVYIMASPVSYDHGKPHLLMAGWICAYLVATPGVDGGDNTSVRLGGASEPQPDLCLRILEKCGGSSRVDQDRFLAGVPELMVEVSRSSDSYDRTVKKKDYCSAGVREFILWRVEAETIDWFVLRDGDYESLAAGSDGIIRSETFPGLWLDAAATTRRDDAAVMRALQRGIESPEHAQFVDKLRKLME